MHVMFEQFEESRARPFISMSDLLSKYWTENAVAATILAQRSAFL